VHLQALFSESLLSTKFTSYPTEKANLADLTCHQEQKASKCYRVVDKEHTCVRAAETLPKAMHNDDKCPADDGTDHGDTCVTTNTVAADLGQPAAVSQGSGMQHHQKMFTQKEINTIVTFCRDTIQGQMTKENLNFRSFEK